MQTSRWNWWLFAVLVGLGQSFVIIRGWQTDPQGYLFGDSGLYAAATDSLLRDGDLDLLNQCYPQYASLDAARFDPELQGDHSGEFGLSAWGTMTLKQSPVLSIAALPFYGLLGRVGFLVFNVVMLNLLLVLTVYLGGNGHAARIIVALGFLTTPLREYAYNFSPDLFLVALMIGSLVAARSGRVFTAGVLAGIAVSTKIYVVAILLPVPVLILVGQRSLRSLGFHVGGGILGLLPALIMNTWLFGAPWVTGYERQLKIENGVIGLADHTSRFTVPFVEGMTQLLFDARVGMVPTAPLWCLWPIAAVVLLRVRESLAWVLATVGMIGMNFAVFACYDGWNGSVVGNRYLFPALMAGLALIGASVDQVINRARPAGEA